MAGSVALGSTACFYDRADTASSPGDGKHVAIYLFDHASVVEQVNDWLGRLEIPYTLDAIPVTAANAASLVGDLVAISLTDHRSGVSVTPADVGFGVSQVLPIVVELLSRRESIIAVEQPETHLHPRLQARLADLFIDTAQEGGRGNQLVVETHSEHLMLRVQRRIHEGTLDASLVSIVYVDQDADGLATANQLRLNDRGEFLPPNSPGELALSGPQLSLGYLADEATTNKRFPTLFHPRLGYTRWFLTGHVATKDAQGVFHSPGHIDNQVKVLGHRVAMEEV